MKRLFALIALTSAVALAGCEDPRPAEPEVADMPIEEPVAPSIDQVEQPVVAPSATDAPPPADDTLPAEKRTSEESVKPESETLFY